MDITWEMLKPLIVDEVWTGNQVSLKFKASNQAEPLQTMGVAMPSQDEIMKRMTGEIAKSAASNMAIGTGANMLGNMAGVPGLGSALGSVASQAGIGYQMDPAALMQVEITEEVRQATILQAFQPLAAMYSYDAGTWVFTAQ